MSQKFNLKWNDFPSNVSQAFGVFRHEEYLHDVTLITDDKTQISAHKLILSATSDYFKTLFKENASNTHPLVCLNGVSGEELGNILDYMYKGGKEAQPSVTDQTGRRRKRRSWKHYIYNKDTESGCH